jgi:hypothetical protein
MIRKMTILLMCAAFAAGCGRSQSAKRAEQNYQVVQEGQAAGVTSTINGPGEIPPPMTDTAIDTTTNFTLDNPAPLGTSTMPGTVAGTFPSYPPGYYPPQPRPRPAQPMASSSSPSAVKPQPQPAQPQQPPMSDTQVTDAPLPPPTDTTTTSTNTASPPEPPPSEEKAKEGEKTDTTKTDTSSSTPPTTTSTAPPPPPPPPPV